MRVLFIVAAFALNFITASAPSLALGGGPIGGGGGPGGGDTGGGGTGGGPGGAPIPLLGGTLLGHGALLGGGYVAWRWRNRKQAKK